MVESRISTLALHNNTVSDFRRTMVSVTDLTRQISSGVKVDSFADLGTKVERVVGYKTKLNAIDNYLNNNKSVLTRLNIMNNSVEQVEQVASDFRALLTSWKSQVNEREKAAYVQQANAYLKQISSQLNTTSEGRYLFSGTRTNTAPIESPLPALTTPGVAEDNYYQGDSNVFSARVSDSHELEYGVNADNQGFQDLFASIQTAIYAQTNANSVDPDADFNKAMDLASSAIEKLTVVRNNINNNIINLNQVNDQHTDVRVYWNEGLTHDVYMSDEDIAEVTTRISVDRTVLQATFQTFSLLSNLRLSEYLN